MINIKELTKDKIKSLSFEEALSMLDEIILTQSNGVIPLEESIKLYEIGIQLKSFCEEYLNNARMRIEKISFISNDIEKEQFN